MLTDESFSAYDGDAPAEESENDWVAAKTQRPTATLRRKKLYGEAASLSNNAETKSVAPRICRQNIIDTNVPDKQFLIQFNTLDNRMKSKVKKDIELVLNEVEGHYGWMTTSNQKRTFVEKRIQDLKKQHEQYQML